ncbi:SigB/SigF/SigG family RNA polymerase sigma factor [Catenulispora sp. NF23]|uniref:SigB/SigF/SigG family RNA polymerase sigma factor n=1 Tax=Catenulispora pinistramenti TaxID=2705254 RepID=A0ABS5KN89_9ACTN|nr:SigB/SigF/SigG family RNA polymerase sigma factor [Catenulispora pinistramenti]MBS2532831.1 SigB/SigF/SigG family RNA polymerase sigma factor [Catenulispora pinistramenti]MBS2547508.1 SigB/SigF/SigG family RNA polymerase sigma factor [Catenulispora pinistramenti]
METPTEPQDYARERAAARAALARLRRMPSDDPEYNGLREYVIGEYMSYARYIAGRFRQRGESQSDLEQVAYVGLVKAVDNFDPDYGATFLTYATPMITGEVRRHFRDTTWDVHVPRRVQENALAVRAAERDLTQQLGVPPSASQIAERLDLSADEVAEAYEASAAHSAASLDVPVAMADGDGASLGDLMGDDDPAFDLVVDREALKPLLAELSARDKRILLMRFFRSMSQKQIADELGVSQMQVSRLLTQILGRLREGVEARH